MYDLEAIESINIEQLVTPTDRLLLRKRVARGTRRSFDLSHEAAIALVASKKRNALAHAEETMFVRVGRTQRVGRELAGVGALVAGVTWLSFTLACLLT